MGLIGMLGLRSESAVQDAKPTLDAPVVSKPTHIDSSKMTSLPRPAIPTSLTPPPPVIRRIAQAASQVPVSQACFEHATRAIERGLAFLASSQSNEGGWMEGVPAQGSEAQRPSKAASSAVTGLVIRAFAQAGFREATSSVVAKAVSHMISQTHQGTRFSPDPEGGLESYVASCCAVALASLEEPKHAERLQEIVRWLQRVQWDESEGINPEQDWFGGVGYGSKGRPDLSNTQMMLEALHEAEVKTDDAAVQRALAFVARCQNRKNSESAPWASAGSGDGGFVYTVANGGESFASEHAGEGRHGEKLPPGTRSLRSYGSMTYAGYKSLLFAGLAHDDPRVLAALGWMQDHYTLSENPGLGQQGLFYYRLAVARAFAASGSNTLTDSKGTTHDWRCELISTLAGSQQPDGSWVNAQDRWMEGHADLVTAYAVLAIEEAIKPTLQSR